MSKRKDHNRAHVYDADDNDVLAMVGRGLRRGGPGLGATGAGPPSGGAGPPARDRRAG